MDSVEGRDRRSAGDRIRQLRRQRGWTQEQLGQMLGGLGKSAIHKYEAGKATITANMLLQIATIFAVPVTHFYGIPAGDTDFGPWEMVPVYGRVPAGGLRQADDEIEGYETVSALEPKPDLFVRVHGDCMAPWICDNYLVGIREQPEVEEGEMALVAVGDGDSTLKRVHRRGDHVMLTADATGFVPILVHASQVRIIGKVVSARFAVK